VKEMISKKVKYNEMETDIQEIQTKTTSRISVLSLVVGIFTIPLAFLSFKSIFILTLFGLGVISTLILGITALIQVTLNKDELRGRILAILGLCASLVGVICFFLYWITHFTLPT